MSRIIEALNILMDSDKPPSPHGSEFEHVGRADLKAQGFKPKGRGSGNNRHEAALVTWKHAQSTGKLATAVVTGSAERSGWGVLRHGDKVAYAQPHMTVTPEGVLHAYNPKKVMEARYLHRIPKIAKGPSDTKLDFVPNTPTGKRRRRKPMDKLIGNDGRYLRVDEPRR